MQVIALMLQDCGVEWPRKRPFYPEARVCQRSADEVCMRAGAKLGHSAPLSGALRRSKILPSPDLVFESYCLGVVHGTPEECSRWRYADVYGGAVRVDGRTEDECYSHAEKPVTTRCKARVHPSFFEQNVGPARLIALALWH